MKVKRLSRFTLIKAIRKQMLATTIKEREAQRVPKIKKQVTSVICNEYQMRVRIFLPDPFFEEQQNMIKFENVSKTYLTE